MSNSLGLSEQELGGSAEVSLSKGLCFLVFLLEAFQGGRGCSARFTCTPDCRQSREEEERTVKLSQPGQDSHPAT